MTVGGGSRRRERGPSAWSVLRQPRFAKYFAGSLISNTGTWFQDIAAAILIFQLTESTLLVAGLAVLSHGTSLLLSPLGGQLADRFDRRTLLIAVHLAQGFAAMLLAVLVLVGLGGVLAVFAVALVLGVGRAINNPTLQAVVPSMVAPKDIAQASALIAVTFNLARAIGPVAGALAVASVGAAAAFFVNGLTFVTFVILLGSLRLDARAPQSGSSRFRVAIQYAMRKPRLLLILLACMAIGMSTDPAITLGPSLAISHGVGTSSVGWYASAFGIGAVAGAPFAGMLREIIGKGTTGLIALVAIPVAFVGVALSPSAPVAIACFGLAGAFFLIGNADLIASVQESVDDVVRGRVLALWSMAFIGSRPVAALLNGVVTDAFSPQAAIAALAALIFVMAAIIAWGFHHFSSD